MPEEFDPYLHWLGIRDPQRPPNHYRLLGIEAFESDPDVISNAADRQMAHVRTFQAGRRSAESQKVLNELATAKVCLLNPPKKVAYDAQLQAELAGAAMSPGVPTEAAVPALPPSPPSPAARRLSVVWVTVSVLVALGVVLVALLVAFVGRTPSDDGDELAALDGGAESADVSQGAPSPGGATSHAATPDALPPPDATKSEKAAKPEPPKQGGLLAKIEPKGTGQGPPEATPKAKSSTEPPRRPEPKAKSESKSPAVRYPPVSESIGAARAAMKQRDVALARRHLELAEKAATPTDREQIERFSELFAPWEAFWSAVRQGMSECKQGEILRAEGLSAEVVRSGDGPFTVRINGKEQAFTQRDLPTPLALVIADRKLAENTASLPKAAFLIVDPQGDPRQASRLCDESAARGIVPSAGLKAELQQILATTGAPADPGAASVKPAPRLPVPDAAAQQSARKNVRDAFRQRFAQARGPVEKGVLAADLLREAKDAKGDAVARYGLLAEACDLAAAAGDVGQLREVVLETAKGYEVDPLEQQARVLTDASETAMPSPVRGTLARAAIDLAREAIQADSYDAAAQLAKAGSLFAGRMPTGKDRAHTVRETSELVKMVAWCKQQHDLAQQAEKALARDPNNLKAVQFLGTYYTLVREQWDRGLPLLVKGEDPTLKALAEAEQAARRSVTAAEMVKLAEQWTEALPSIEEPLQGSARLRARYWYEAALPHVSGLTKEGVVRAIEALKQGDGTRRK